MLVPLGPVAVFGSSNFPLAYSVAGGDTASALAAGCPVVVKAHPAHPGTGELVARAVVSALQRSGIPAGAFALVHGRANEVGAALVRHPATAAVGFTGSLQGGRALCDLAAARPSPIPVFAEMGSANPVFVLPGALRERGPAIAAMLAASSLLATGQMCTSPGLAVLGKGADADAFVAALGAALSGSAPGTMVSASIRANFDKALAEVRAVPGVQDVAAAKGQGGPAQACAVLLQTTAADFLQKPRLGDEVYGPAMVAVRCTSRPELLATARALHGHLTATVHGTAADLREHQDLLAILRTKAGRLVCNGVPTGVEVAPAMQHGGPWPASSDARFSAVGTSSILRWARPVCFQDWPPEHLPEELRDGNPRGIFRTVDGVLGRH
jgi:NADP-dependent aldehyde dehydrogenase